jgi:hypothetical protein
LLLGFAEIKESQGQRSVAIADLHQQAAPSAIFNFDLINFDLDHGVIAGPQTADRYNARAVLIAARQMKQHILNGLYAESRQLHR